MTAGHFRCHKLKTLLFRHACGRNFIALSRLPLAVKTICLRPIHLQLNWVTVVSVTTAEVYEAELQALQLASYNNH